ncbi:MAG TPA: FG-GAP-like repeat-containing protein [Pyrinomonadaceae bacterium]|jgi:uncharacterized delta-60 repeat protein|nr:FG-GAP-like repeat-containing protein [Pyrinomonadaceae bacterium]
MKMLIIKSLLLTTAVFGLISTALAASPGSLDPSFGTAGFVKTNILGTDFLRDIAVQEDGKIVAVGGSGVSDFTIVRYTANGALDPTFSGDGIAFVDFGGPSDAPTDVEIQPDGKIVVSGNISNSGPSGVVRLNPNGTLDTTFDTDGKLTLNDFVARGMDLQADGKIVLAGRSTFFELGIEIVRLNPNGSFDTTFDADGIALKSIEGNDALNEVKIQSDGKIVGAGNAGGSNKALVVRYNANGTLDTSFSGDGIALNDFAPNIGEPTSDLVINPVNGAITTLSDNFTAGNSLLFIRYASNGNLDPNFSGDGRLEIPAVESGCVGTLQLQSDGKLIAAAGRGCGTVSDDVFLVRLNDTGTIDPTFGSNGTVLSVNDAGGAFKTVLVGDKLIVGNNSNSSADFGLERYNLSNTPTAASDFDGDGISDIAVFRPSNGNWFVLRSSDNAVSIFQFGVNGDIPMDGDFDGDGRTDVAIYRPSDGQWWLNRSSAGIMVANFGTSTDKPSPGDYDRDGKTDVAVFRPATGEWLILRSSSNFSTFFGFTFGQNGDIPIASQRK